MLFRSREEEVLADDRVAELGEEPDPDDAANERKRLCAYVSEPSGTRERRNGLDGANGCSSMVLDPPEVEAVS